jgi:hypothetical protein
MSNKQFNINAQQVNIADTINSIEYRQQFGVNQQEFSEIIKALMQLSQSDQHQMAEVLKPLPQAQTPEAKQSLGEKIKSVMGKVGIGAAGKLTAEGIVELIKYVGPHIPWIVSLLSQAR